MKMINLSNIFNGVGENDKDLAIETIIKNSSPKSDFFLMLILSVSMATFGILLNSIVILVASMLIAPLIFPVISLALGFVTTDQKLIGISSYTIFKSLLYSVVVSAVISFLFSNRLGSEVFNSFGLTDNSASPLMYILVASIAGFAAAFAMIKPNLNDALPGVAIAVSLVPPLSAMGVSLSVFDWTVFSSSILLFIGNIIGIVFSSMIVFSLFKFSIKKEVSEKIIEKEEKTLG